VQYSAKRPLLGYFLLQQKVTLGVAKGAGIAPLMFEVII